MGCGAATTGTRVLGFGGLVDAFLADSPEDAPRADLTRIQQPRTLVQLEVKKMRSSYRYKTGSEQFRRRMSQMNGGRGAPCSLCGQEISYSIPHPHPASFSVDHSVSAHERPDLFFDQNLWKPAHLGCNSARGGAAEDLLGPGALGNPSEVF